MSSPPLIKETGLTRIFSGWSLFSSSVDNEWVRQFVRSKYYFFRRIFLYSNYSNSWISYVDLFSQNNELLCLHRLMSRTWRTMGLTKSFYISYTFTEDFHKHRRKPPSPYRPLSICRMNCMASHCMEIIIVPMWHNLYPVSISWH